MRENKMHFFFSVSTAITSFQQSK